jgi:hypothetical protein
VHDTVIEPTNKVQNNIKTIKAGFFIIYQIFAVLKLQNKLSIYTIK